MWEWFVIGYLFSTIIDIIIFAIFKEDKDKK